MLEVECFHILHFQVYNENNVNDTTAGYQKCNIGSYCSHITFLCLMGCNYRNKQNGSNRKEANAATIANRVLNRVWYFIFRFKFCILEANPTRFIKLQQNVNADAKSPLLTQRINGRNKTTFYLICCRMI